MNIVDFLQALREGWPRIENEVLSGFHSPVVTLCNGISKLVLEPYIDTGPYEWRENGLECTGDTLLCLDVVKSLVVNQHAVVAGKRKIWLHFVLFFFAQVSL